MPCFGVSTYSFVWTPQILRYVCSNPSPPGVTRPSYIIQELGPHNCDESKYCEEMTGAGGGGGDTSGDRGRL